MKNKHKKKKILMAITCLLIIIECTTVFLMYKSLSNKKTTLDEVKILNNSSNSGMFAIMLENQSGEYEQSQSNAWPTSEYTFNSERSGCMDSSGKKIPNALEFSNGVARIKTNKKVSCYMYFDIEAAEAFAIYSETDNSLRFYKNGDEVEAGDIYNDLVVTELYTKIEEDEYTSSSKAPWTENYINIQTVEFVDIITPVSTAYWFYGLSIDTLDLSKLNVSNVTNMSSMFEGICGYQTPEMTITGINSWNTANVTNMSYTFSGSFTFLDLTNLDVSNVTDMSGTFNGIGSRIDGVMPNVTGWNTSNVTNMSSIFSEVSEIPDEIVNWDVSSVTNMMNMFSFSAHIPDISKWNVSNVTIMHNMFEETITGYTAENPLDLSGWDVSKVTGYNGFADYISPEGSIIPPNFGTTS